MARKYTLKFADNLKPEDDFVQWADELFTELGLSPELAQKAVDRWGEFSNRRLAQLETEYQGKVDALRREWGSDFDSNVQAGRKAMKALGLSEAELTGLEMASGFHGAMSVLARIGKSVSSGGSGDTPKLSVMTADEAKAELARLQGDKVFQDTMRDVRNPHARTEAVRRYEHLNALAYPAPEAAPASSPQFTGALADKNTPTKSAAAQKRLEQLKADPAFMDSVFDTRHTAHETNKATWMALQGEAYAEEGGAQ